MRHSHFGHSRLVPGRLLRAANKAIGRQIVIAAFYITAKSPYRKISPLIL